MHITAVSAVISLLLLTAAGRASCPEINRLASSYPDAQLSMSGGAAPFNARAADDFQLPFGNGNSYNIRQIKFVMIANYTLTPSNVSFTINFDVWNGTRALPGSTAAGPPNSPANIRDLGPYAGDPSFHVYEISYPIPSGFLQLAPGQWYWLVPYAIGSAVEHQAYAAVNTTLPLVGEVANKAFGAPPSGTLGPWELVTDCCLPACDLAMYVDGVQAGRFWSDFNCDLVIGVQDIFSFLESWFASLPIADFNGSAGVGTQDIFDFLAAWFVGA